MSARSSFLQQNSLEDSIPGADVEVRVLATLKGYTFYVPDPQPMYEAVPFGFSPCYPRLERKVDDILAGLGLDAKSLRKAKEIDVAYLTCAQFPRADWDALVVFAHYNIWIFLWDDETDQELPGARAGEDPALAVDPALTAAAPAPTIASDLLLGAAYRDQSFRYITHRLGMPCPGARADDEDNKDGCGCDCRRVLGARSGEEPAPPTAVSAVFAAVGPALRARCDEGEVGRFWVRVRRYMAATAAEQEARLAGRFPSLERFSRMRYFSAGVLVQASLALMRFSCGATVSFSDLSFPIQQQLIYMQDKVNRNLMVMNDIFSLKKELAEGTLINMIPLAVADMNATGPSPPETTAVAAAATAAARLQIGSEPLPEGHAESAEMYTACLELLARGSVNWTLHTERYGVKEFIQDDGSLAIVL